MIKFVDVSKKYSEGTTALDEASFNVEKGEFVFLVGPSGAGKTTVLRLLLRQIFPTKGKVFVNGEEISSKKFKHTDRLRQKIGVAFQDFKLLYDRTVFENIAIALEILNKEPEEIKKEVLEVLKLVGLEEKAKCFPLQLSGGEFQRCVIARAVVAKPEILFADEPTGNLDPDTSWQIVNLLSKINKSGTTVLMSTHNMDVVDSLNKRVIKMDKGKILKDKKKKA